MSADQLPVEVLKQPHWRVNIRPRQYCKELIPSLAQCIALVEKTRVSLRGWDYPHLSNRENERQMGLNYVSSWSDFWGHNEYWRLYQSGQFIHLFSVRESVEAEWHKQLEASTKAHLAYRTDVAWASVRGYIDAVNMLYTITEVFEFAARLCQSGMYTGMMDVSVGLHGIKDFLLTVGNDRLWHSYCRASIEEMSRECNVGCEQLVSSSGDHALAAAAWFYERFGWIDPPIEALKRDQAKFLAGRL